MPTDRKKTKSQDNPDTGRTGYANPPREHRFKKGQSGNPKGRPRKASRSQNEVIFSLLKEIVTYSENGKKMRGPNLEVLIKSLVAKAITGDIKAVRMLQKFKMYVDIHGDLTPTILHINDTDAEL